jgi:hypothetical protein
VQNHADSAQAIGQASRSVAEEAQKKAEAHLERVARLEGELLSLRSAPVPAQTRPRKTGPTAPPSATPAQNPNAPSASSAVPGPPRPIGVTSPRGWNSAIASDFPKLFEEFREKQFALLWRGSPDGFSPKDFHARCDGHGNTLTVILDTDGNIFGGFTPVEWDSKFPSKADPNLKSFIFTLKNPADIPARRFPLKSEAKDKAIHCVTWCGPHFHDICVSNGLSGQANSWTELGRSYTKDTGLDGTTFFTGSKVFTVKEVEVFEITD